MKLVNLKHYHTATKQFKHPLLDGVKPVSVEHIDALTEEVMKDPSRADELALDLRSCIRHMVSRYLGNWPSSEPFVDDMVSEGLLAVSLILHDLSPKLLNGRSLMKVVSQRAQRRIEVMLNAMQSLAAPFESTQREIIKAGGEPIYLQTSGDVEDDIRTVPGDIFKRDVMEALRHIETQDELDEAILSREYWGRTGEELAKEFGVNQATVHRRKQRLYEQYLNLTR